MSPRHIALGVLIAAIWGLNFVVIRLGLDDFPPLLYAALRYAAAVPFVLLVPRPPIPWSRLVGIGVFLGALTFGLLFVGISLGMPAGLASLMMQAQMLFTAGFAVLLLGERPTGRQLAGMAVAIFGGVLIGLELDRGGNLTALLAVIGGAAAWGAGNIFLKRTRAPNMLNLMVWMSLVPPLPLLALSLWLEGTAQVGAALAGLDASGVGTVLYNGWLANIVGFGLWALLLRHYPAGTVAPFSLLVPVFGMTSAAVLLGEALSPTKLVASALILLGLALIVWRPRRPAPTLSAGSAPRP